MLPFDQPNPKESTIHLKNSDPDFLSDASIIRKRINDAAHENEKHYRMVFELFADYVYKIRVDASGEIHFESVSDNYNSITGRSKQEAATLESWKAFIHPDDFHKLTAAIERQIQEPVFCQLDCRSFLKSGEMRWVHVVSRSEWSEKENRITTIYGAVRDITSQKKAELELNEKKEEIEAQNKEYQRLNEELLRINSELSLAKEKAEESDRMKTSFLQNMSHEIRTPMNAIMGFSSLLVDYINDPAKIEKYAEIINLRCTDLLEIINDLLDISKIESGQLTLNNELCNLSELNQEIYTLFREHQKKIKKEAVHFEVRESAEIQNTLFIIDKIKLKQILINLINNAFKFTFAGTVEYGCRITGAGQLEYYVSDTGRGIPADKFLVIFERFTQLAGKGEASSGTGLGLSIVKGLLNLMGGTIQVESQCENPENHKMGFTTFRFSVPVETLINKLHT